MRICIRLLLFALIMQACFGCEKHEREMRAKLRQMQLAQDRLRMKNIKAAQDDAVTKLRRELLPSNRQFTVPLTRGSSSLASRRFVPSNLPVYKSRSTYYQNPVSTVRSRQCSNALCPVNHYCVQYSDGYRCRKNLRPPTSSSYRPSYYRPSYRPIYYDPRNLRVAKDEECKEGYERSVLEDETYDYCKEIDECSIDRYLCGNRGERCRNYPFGKYTCYCLRGYMFNGTTCVDKNECEQTSRVCGQICDNADGSYYCSCRVGYRTTSFGYGGCIDVDECREGTHSCGSTTYCLNLIGSHKCIPQPECPDNFVSVAGQKATCIFDRRLGTTAEDLTDVPDSIRYIQIPAPANATRTIGSLMLSTQRKSFNFTTEVRMPNTKIGYDTEIVRSIYRSKRFKITFTALEPIDDEQEEHLILDVLETSLLDNGGVETKVHRLDLTVFGYITNL